ncbi:plastocyanin, partial [Variovorax sp. PCZ-1]|nr:plastocyanin [Variovorax sp. PCZ-1]
MKRRNAIQIAALAAATGAMPMTFAHGNEDHSKKAGPVKKEQKPWGIAGDEKDIKRTVAVSMGDNMRFTPG